MRAPLKTALASWAPSINTIIIIIIIYYKIVASQKILGGLISVYTFQMEI